MLKIVEPLHGAVLNHRHGKQNDEGMRIEVACEAPLDYRVCVNGVEAERAGKGFSAGVTLTDKENDIVAVGEGPRGRLEHSVRVLWDRFSKPRYRFSIDDNSFFLRDIASKKYGSLFGCFYLKILKDLNEKYGAKFALNCYFTTGADFSLPQFPDTYKGEWADNAHWLKLSFHAFANEPARPYQHASGAKLAYDFDLVANEIMRFAGEATWSPPTVIHWGMVQAGALHVLVERGVKALSGFFHRRAHGYDVNYFVDDARSDYLSRRDALMDFDSGIVFSNADIVCNNTAVEDIVPKLEPLTRDPNTAEIMDLFTHEQYFWPFHTRHLPDHAERLETAIRFCAENGYEPVFFHEGFLGGEDWPEE